MKIYSSIVFTYLLTNINAFNPLSKQKINTFNKKGDKSIIFYTAAFNKIPNDVYSDLIDKFVDDDLKVVVPSEVKSNKFINKFDDKVTIIGHSSGCINAIEASENKNVDKLILIDPIDNRFFNDEDDMGENIELDNIEKALFLYTKKSYDSKFMSFPFVPDKISLKPEQLNIKNNDNKDIIEISNYGHCDILDKHWSDFADRFVTKGHKDRENIKKYHKWLSMLTAKFANDDFENFESEKINKFMEDDYKYITKKNNKLEIIVSE